jgi:hypothetical protein
MPPAIENDLLPGKEGVDYHFVKYGDKVYVVYRIEVAPGRFVNTTWRVDKGDFKALGIDPGKVRGISKKAFRSLNVFGAASEIARGEKDVHPFQKYIRQLKELHGDVSWLHNREFMSVMLMGWAENWSAEELRQRLTQTKWYQNRTSFQRAWEMDMNDADRDASLGVWNARMKEALRQLYGPDITPEEAGFDMKKFEDQVKRIASGKWGSPEEGFAVWLESARRDAEKIEGTVAWIERQQQLEDQRGFMNRPEDMFEQLREDAMQWLGPRGMPDRQTLRKWSEDLVSELRSDGDWQKFLRKQAQALYPWLGPDETWMDRASVYRSIAEEELGRAVTWDDGLLYQIGGTDGDGAPTNEALSFDDFTRLIRSKDEWWKSDNAQQKGFELHNYINEVFQGVRV